MNEKQKIIIKDSGKKIGLVAISIAVILILSGGSLDLINKFTTADVMGKAFYIIFAAFGAYNLGMAIRGFVGLRETKAPGVNQSDVHDSAQVGGMTKEPDVFEQFSQELSRGLHNPGGTAGDLTSHLKTKIEEFNQKLDSDVTELEQQYTEMDKLRIEVNKNVDDLYKDYQKLEQQMQITNGMIKTKRVVRDRIKQLREGK